MLMYNEYDFGISLKPSLNRVGQIYFKNLIFQARNFTSVPDQAHKKAGG